MLYASLLSMANRAGALGLVAALIIEAPCSKNDSHIIDSLWDQRFSGVAVSTHNARGHMRGKLHNTCLAEQVPALRE